MKRTPRNRRAASAPPETALKPGGKPRAPRRPKPADPATVREIFTRFRAANPHPKGDLEFINPFTLLIAVVLSAQTTDAGVNKATRELFPIADTPQKILALGETNLRERFKSLGFFNTKAKNVIALCEQLIAKYDGRVPTRREELEALPGVGRKTANVVLNVAFAQPDDRRRHACVSRVEPHSTGDRRDAARGRARIGKGHSGRVQDTHASLADPARAIHMQSAPAGMRALHHSRFVPFAGEAGVALSARSPSRPGASSDRANRSRARTSRCRSCRRRAPDCRRSPHRLCRKLR